MPPEEFSPGIATWYHTVCSMCSSGCGISVRTREGRAKKIEGNPAHPVNQGRLCARGQAGLQVLYNPDRITDPMQQTGARESGDWQPLTWAEGRSQLAERLSALRADGEGGAVCLLSEGVRGHLHTLFDRFMGELGSDRLVYYDYDHPHPLHAAMNRLFGRRSCPISTSATHAICCPSEPITWVAGCRRYITVWASAAAARAAAAGGGSCRSSRGCR